MVVVMVGTRITLLVNTGLAISELSKSVTATASIQVNST